MDNKTNDLNTDMKYQLLTGDTIQISHPVTGLPVKLHRIISLKTFKTYANIEVKEHEIGGYVQSLSNLSQDDSSWISQTAKVFDNANVYGDSLITHSAAVYGSAKVDSSYVAERARVYQNAYVAKSSINDNSDISGDSRVMTSSTKNWTVITGKSNVTKSFITGGSRISGNSNVLETTLNDQSEVKGNSTVSYCKLSGRSVVSNQTILNQTLNETIELYERIGTDGQ